MSVLINSGFQLLNEAEAIDSRCLYVDIASMAAAEVGIYDGCMCYVQTGTEEEIGYYKFLKANDVDSVTGKWRKIEFGGGGDVIDDTLGESSTKTYSINKIKELLNKNGGSVLVNELPDLTDPDQFATVNLSKTYYISANDPDDPNAKIGYICMYDKESDSYTWEEFSKLSGDAGMVFEESFVVTNGVGKMGAGRDVKDLTVLDVIKDMLSKDIKPEAVLTLGPTNIGALFEKNVSVIADVSLTANFRIGTGEFADDAAVIFKRGTEEISSQPYVAGVTQYTFTDTGANISDDTTYSVELAYTMGGTPGVAKAVQTYNFALPVFYGFSATKAIADITALTKLLSEEDTVQLSFTAQNGYCVFAVPDSVTVATIKDQNGFDNTSSFTSVSQVATLGSTPVNYIVYTNKNAVTCTNFKYTFYLE